MLDVILTPRIAVLTLVLSSSQSLELNLHEMRVDQTRGSGRVSVRCNGSRQVDLMLHQVGFPCGLASLFLKRCPEEDCTYIHCFSQCSTLLCDQQVPNSFASHIRSAQQHAVVFKQGDKGWSGAWYPSTYNISVPRGATSTTVEPRGQRREGFSNCFQEVGLQPI